MDALPSISSRSDRAPRSTPGGCSGPPFDFERRDCSVPAGGRRAVRLRRQGERYFADGLRELPDNRRLAILAVCAVEWEMFLADAVVETHDRLVGRPTTGTPNVVALFAHLSPGSASTCAPGASGQQ